MNLSAYYLRYTGPLSHLIGVVSIRLLSPIVGMKSYDFPPGGNETIGFGPKVGTFRITTREQTFDVPLCISFSVRRYAIINPILTVADPSLGGQFPGTLRFRPLEQAIDWYFSGLRPFDYLPGTNPGLTPVNCGTPTTLTGVKGAYPAYMLGSEEASPPMDPALWNQDYSLSLAGAVPLCGTAPPPVGACCGAYEGFPNDPPSNCREGRTLLQCQQERGTRWTQGTTCAAASCPPVGACCKPTGSCVIDTQASCQIVRRGVYRGDGVQCDRNPAHPTCPEVNGACCVGESCQITTASDCAHLGGTFLGAGGTCTPNPCSGPLAACCFPDGHCEDTPSINCINHGGIPHGGLCDQTQCPADGACCINTGTQIICEMHDAADCLAANGLFQGVGTSCDTPEICAPRGACCLFQEPGGRPETCYDNVTFDGCYAIPWTGSRSWSSDQTCSQIPCGQSPGFARSGGGSDGGGFADMGQGAESLL